MIQLRLLQIGCEIEILLSFWGFGKGCIIPILNTSNSKGLMENLNAVFINDNIPQSERLVKLNQVAIQQMKVLEDVNDRKLLK